jgi:hypothetical protein
MPVKPENKHRYPKNWPEVRAAIVWRARGRCEQCGVKNHEIGGRTRDGSWLKAHPMGRANATPGSWWWCSNGTRLEYLRIVRIVLTVAHLDHQPENNSPENLRALCQRCHLAHDHVHHQQNAYATRRKGKAAGDLFA